MSVLDTTLSSAYNSLYQLDSYQTLTNVIAKNVTAYKNDLGAAQDLVIGASSNVHVEAVTSVSSHVKDTGLFKFFATTTSNNQRVDEEIFRIAKGSSATLLTAGSNMGLTLVSRDNMNTAKLSGVTMCNNGVYQYITADKPLKFDAVGTAMSNLVASDHVFGSDFNLVKTYQSASNPGDLVKAGYSFRMNDDNHLELLRYSNFLESGGSRDVYVKVATFGRANIVRDSVGDIEDYDAYDTYSNISKFNPHAPALISDSAWVAGVQGAIAAKTDGAGNTYLVGVSGYTSTTVPWAVPTAMYTASGAVSSVSLYNPPGNDIKMFIVKYNSTGAVVWARGIAGGVDLKTAHICFDSRNYVTIVCNGTTTGSFTLTYSNSTTVSKTCAATPSGKTADIAWTFSRDGEFINVVQIVGVESSSSNRMPVGLYDNRDNLHVSGVYDRSNTLNVINYDDQTSFIALQSRTPVSVNNKVAYIAKFNASKRVLWIASPGFNRWKSSIGIDGQGNVYMAGYTYKSHEPVLNADGFISSSVVLGSFMKSDDVNTSCLALIKFNSSGIAQWAAGSDMPYVNEYDVGVTVNTYDEIFLTGIFESTTTQPFKVYNSSGTAADFTWPTTYRPAGEYKATYCIKYNTLGSPQWAFMIETTLNDINWVPSPIFDTAGNLIIAQGFKDDTIVFYNADGTTYRTLYPAGTDGGSYIAKYSAQSGSCMWADYACAGLTEIRDVAGGAGTSDTYILMNDTAPLGKTDPTIVTYADWSTATLPPIKTVLVKVAHNSGYPALSGPLPSSTFPSGFTWSRFDNANFNETNKDLDWFKGMTPNASGSVASIASMYTSSPNPFSAYGITGNGTNFGLILRGYFRPSRTGEWRFTLVANDYAMMWIGDAATSPGTTNKSTNTFITTDSTNSYTSASKTSATVSLVGNQYYPVLIYYGQSSSDSTLSLTYYGPGVPNSTEGSGYYFHDINWASPFVPTGIPAGPLINLQAKTLSALSNGDRVQTWGDFTQSTLGSRPLYIASTYGSGYNGGAFVSFTAMDRQTLYTNSAIDLSNVVVNGGMTYILLIRVKSNLNTLVHTDQFTSPRVYQASGTNMMTVGVSPTNIGYTPNTWQVFMYKLDNTNQRLIVKRNNITIVDLSNSGTTVTGPVRFGIGSTATSSTDTASSWTDADVGAYIVYDRPLTDSEMTQLYTYIFNGYATDD